MPKSKGRILVVEDNADEAQMVKMILEPEGYGVTLAADGQQGLEKACAERPDLIILDVMMPVLDGFSMCARLRNEPQNREIPVILLTGVAERVRDTKYPLDGVLRAEVQDYLEKPVEPAALVATVAQWLG